MTDVVKKIVMWGLIALLAISLVSNGLQSIKHGRTYDEYSNRVVEFENAIREQESIISGLGNTISKYEYTLRERKELELARERELQAARETIQRLIAAEESDLESITNLEQLYIEVGRRLSEYEEK
jgi:hypothetical protein